MRARTGVVGLLLALGLAGCSSASTTQAPDAAAAGVLGHTAAGAGTASATAPDDRADDETPDELQDETPPAVAPTTPQPPPEPSPPATMELPQPAEASPLGEVATEADGTRITTYSSLLAPADLQARYLAQMEATGWSLSSEKPPYEQTKPWGVVATYQSAYTGVDALLLVRATGLPTGGTTEHPSVLHLEQRPLPGATPES